MTTLAFMAALRKGRRCEWESFLRSHRLRLQKSGLSAFQTSVLGAAKDTWRLSDPLILSGPVRSFDFEWITLKCPTLHCNPFCNKYLQELPVCLNAINERP